MKKDNIGPDPVMWISRLREVNRGSYFTASERALIEKRLASLEKELKGPKPFVEEKDAIR